MPHKEITYDIFFIVLLNKSIKVYWEWGYEYDLFQGSEAGSGLWAGICKNDGQSSFFKMPHQKPHHIQILEHKT